jgi:retron-type reverse transcriptase
VISGKQVEWVLEAELKNFFRSLSHECMLRFVEYRVGAPRLISLMRRWLKANVLEDEQRHPNEEGTPQGGSISVLLFANNDNCREQILRQLTGWRCRLEDQYQGLSTTK